MTSNSRVKRVSIYEAPVAEDRAKAALDERDEKSIVKLLKDAGVTSYEPRVVNQLVERMRRYTTEILIDARDYADHAGRVDIAMDDIRLALRKKQDALSAGPPSREDLIRLADEVNRLPLPPVPDAFGVRLPPLQYQTTLPNVQWETDEEPLQPHGTANESMDSGTVAQGNRNKRKPKPIPKFSSKKGFFLKEKATQDEESKAKALAKAARRRAQLLAQQAGRR